MIYEGKIDKDDLILTRIAIGDETPDENPASLPIGSLSKIFSAIEASGFGALQTMTLRDAEAGNPSASSVSVFGVDLKDIFSKAQGFAMVPTVSALIPGGFLFDLTRNDEGEDVLDLDDDEETFSRKVDGLRQSWHEKFRRSDEFVHNLLTQVAARGVKGDDGEIAVEYEGYLPPDAGKTQSVTTASALIAPDAVSRIEDMGAYRHIYLEKSGDAARDKCITTFETKAALEELFDLQGRAPLSPSGPRPS